LAARGDALAEVPAPKHLERLLPRSRLRLGLGGAAAKLGELNVVARARRQDEATVDRVMERHEPLALVGRVVALLERAQQTKELLSHRLAVVRAGLVLEAERIEQQPGPPL